MYPVGKLNLVLKYKNSCQFNGYISSFFLVIDNNIKLVIIRRPDHPIEVITIIIYW